MNSTRLSYKNTSTSVFLTFSIVMSQDELISCCFYPFMCSNSVPLLSFETCAKYCNSWIPRSEMGIILKSGNIPRFANIYSQIWEFNISRSCNIIPRFEYIYIRKSGNISQISELFPDQTLIPDCVSPLLFTREGTLFTKLPIYTLSVRLTCSS